MKAQLTKDFTLEQAIKIAEQDYNYGIVFAIDLLESYGFDCSYYWKKVSNWENIEDYQNIEFRDKLYKRLGIKETMEQAYDIVWCCGV